MTLPKQKKLTAKEFDVTVTRLTKRAERLAAEINQLDNTDGSVLKLYTALQNVSHSFNMRAMAEREELIQKGLKQYAEDVRTGKIKEGPSTALPEDLMYNERCLKADMRR